MKIYILLLSIILFYIAFIINKKNKINEEPVWLRFDNITCEHVCWSLSIIFMIIFLCLLLYKKNEPKSYLYIGYFFLFIHMMGQWFYKDKKIKRKNNTFKQYLIDNILGNLTYDKKYDTKKVPLNNFLINRNLSILFLTIYIYKINY
tara:strand:- start:5002 stop:5442 length:441 start_codon:yes stop_codon:yes gene_type:complete